MDSSPLKPLFYPSVVLTKEGLFTREPSCPVLPAAAGGGQLVRSDFVQGMEQMFDFISIT
jgi:hypothetical protein